MTILHGKRWSSLIYLWKKPLQKKQNERGALEENSISKARFLWAFQCLGHAALVSPWNLSLQEREDYLFLGETQNKSCTFSKPRYAVTWIGKGEHQNHIFFLTKKKKDKPSLHNSLKLSWEAPSAVDNTVLCYNMVFCSLAHHIISQLESKGIQELFIELWKFYNTELKDFLQGATVCSGTQ